MIGSGRDCAVRLDPSPLVATHHAVVWIKDGKIMLRHVGGPWRSTKVADRPVNWVILENGDEFTVGEQTFRAEEDE